MINIYQTKYHILYITAILRQPLSVNISLITCALHTICVSLHPALSRCQSRSRNSRKDGQPADRCIVTCLWGFLLVPLNLGRILGRLLRWILQWIMSNLPPLIPIPISTFFIVILELSVIVSETALVAFMPVLFVFVSKADIISITMLELLIRFSPLLM